MKLENRKDYRIRRHKRLRQKIAGTAARPRMSVFVSNSHMYVQFIDDDAGTTLAAASTLGMDAKLNIETAKAKGITTIVIDRGGFRFHGRVKQLVETVLASGLKVREEEAE